MLNCRILPCVIWPSERFQSGFISGRFLRNTLFAGAPETLRPQGDQPLARDVEVDQRKAGEHPIGVLGQIEPQHSLQARRRTAAFALWIAGTDKGNQTTSRNNPILRFEKQLTPRLTRKLLESTLHGQSLLPRRAPPQCLLLYPTRTRLGEFFRGSLRRRNSQTNLGECPAHTGLGCWACHYLT